MLGYRLWPSNTQFLLSFEMAALTCEAIEDYSVDLVVKWMSDFSE